MNTTKRTQHELSFTVIYQTGGTDNYRWNKTGIVVPTIEEANAKAVELERAGYPCYVKRVWEVENIGMPDDGDGTNQHYFQKVGRYHNGYKPTI